jgi:hypothetical protein
LPREYINFWNKDSALPEVVIRYPFQWTQELIYGIAHFYKKFTQSDLNPENLRVQWGFSKGNHFTSFQNLVIKTPEVTIYAKYPVCR